MEAAPQGIKKVFSVAKEGHKLCLAISPPLNIDD